MSSPVSERWLVVNESSWSSNDPIVSVAVTTGEISSENEMDSDEDIANQILGMSLNELDWCMQEGLLPKKRRDELLLKKFKLSDNKRRNKDNLYYLETY